MNSLVKIEELLGEIDSQSQVLIYVSKQVEKSFEALKNSDVVTSAYNLGSVQEVLQKTISELSFFKQDLYENFYELIKQTVAEESNNENVVK